MATQKDLAKLAGVSAGTVSNVISGAAAVSGRAREKVLKAIRTLNYRPNLIARSLKTNRTNTLGIVVPDIKIAFFAELIRGAELAARAHGYFLLVLDSQGNHDLELEMLTILTQRVDGILLVTAGAHGWSAKAVSEARKGLPLVCVDRVPRGLHTDSVCVDNVGAAELGIAHLLSMGHRKIALVTGPLTLKNEQERLRGCLRAMRFAGLAERDLTLWASSFDDKRIQRACQKGLLRMKTKPTAIFATNGTAGVRVLQSAFELGLSTPADFAFANIDEITTAEFFRPRITTVVQPTHEIGRRAAELALERIRHGCSNAKPASIQLQAKLVVRETSTFSAGSQKNIDSGKKR